jgi:hypothetical protein
MLRLVLGRCSEREPVGGQQVRQAVPGVGDAAAVAGVELASAAGLGSLAASKLPPGAVFGVYALIAGISLCFSARSRQVAWRFIATRVAPVCLSFLATVPGVLYFVQLPNRNGRLCESLPMFSISAQWVFVGPLLLFVSFRRARGWFHPTLVVVWALHALAWFLGAANTMLCAMTI